MLEMLQTLFAFLDFQESKKYLGKKSKTFSNQM
jgi:hypothetical protein